MRCPFFYSDEGLADRGRSFSCSECPTVGGPPGWMLVWHLRSETWPCASKKRRRSLLLSKPLNSSITWMRWTPAENHPKPSAQMLVWWYSSCVFWLIETKFWYVCFVVCVCVHVGLCACWGRSYNLLPYFWGQDLLQILELTNSARLPGQWAPVTLLSLSIPCWGL